MKHVKCNVLSEFDGTINGHHISDEELYYTMSHTLTMIAGTLQQIKIKKEKQFVDDIIIGMRGLHVIDRIDPIDINLSIFASLGSFKNNDLKTLVLGKPTPRISKKALNTHMGLVNERLKSGYYLK